MDICGYVLVRSPRGISISLDLALKRVRSLALARRSVSGAQFKDCIFFKVFPASRV